LRRGVPYCDDDDCMPRKAQLFSGGAAGGCTAEKGRGEIPKMRALLMINLSDHFVAKRDRVSFIKRRGVERNLQENPTSLLSTSFSERIDRVSERRGNLH